MSETVPPYEYSPANTPLRTALAAELGLPPEHPDVGLAVALHKRCVLPIVRRHGRRQVYVVLIGPDGAPGLYAQEGPLEARRDILEPGGM